MNQIVSESDTATARKIEHELCPHRQKEAMRKARKRLSHKRAAQSPDGKLRLPAVRHG